MKIMFAFALGVALSGCAASSQSVMAPDGKRAYVVKCNARLGVHKLNDEVECFQEAEKLCPTGYGVLTSDEGKMLIRCK